MIILNKSQAETILSLVVLSDSEGGASEDAYKLAQEVADEFPSLKEEYKSFVDSIPASIEYCKKVKADNLAI